MTTFTLICDGSSDYALKHIVEWIIESNDLFDTYDIKIADFRQHKATTNRVVDKIELAHKEFKADYYIIHRDAERESFEDRESEIKQGVADSGIENKYFIFAIPVKMLESWFLTDIDAIKKGAGNPNYSGKLVLPKLSAIERITDPKKTLHTLLFEACGLTGRRAKTFNANKAYHNVAYETSDFSNAKSLDSFNHFLTSFLAAVK